MHVLLGTSDGPIHGGGNLRVTAAVLSDDGTPWDVAPSAVSLSAEDEDGAAIAAAAGAMTRVDEDAGQATAGAARTLTDSLQAWRPEEWRGAIVQIVAGTGSGQVRRVAHNTATVLTIEGMLAGAWVGDWVTIPDATSQYRLHRSHWARTWAVPASLEGTEIMVQVLVTDPAGGDVVRRAVVRVEAL